MPQFKALVRRNGKKLFWAVLIAACGSVAFAAQYRVRTRRAVIRSLNQREVDAQRVNVSVTYARECGDELVGYNLVSLGSNKLVDPHVIGVEILVQGALRCNGGEPDATVDFDVTLDESAGVRFEKLQPDAPSEPAPLIDARLH